MKRLKKLQVYTVTKVVLTFILSHRERRFAVRVHNASTFVML